MNARKSPVVRKFRGVESSSWKNGCVKNNTVSPAHKAYVPPALHKYNGFEDKGESALNSNAPMAPYAGATKPDLPQKLVDEFKAPPENYPGLIPALHSEDNFAVCVEKWKKLGVLFAEDIIRNAPAHCPIDYNLRVSENDTQTAFGQVDKHGRMQGLGRECYDFIYEGQFKDNVYHGWGRYICHEGVYWGHFNEGVRNGQGKWVGTGGDTKEGNWVNGHFK